MKQLFQLLTIAALGVLGGTQSAWAATATNTFDVTITVQPSCAFTAPSTISALDFGSAVASTATNGATTATGSTTFNMQCTIGTAPVISLSSANGWKMVGIDSTPYDNTAATIAYTLSSDSAGSTAWNTTMTVTALSDGSDQTFTVYGAVADTGKTVGNFKDTVTVTLTY